METFHKLFGSLLSFVYHCFDRVVILAYLPLLTREENLVHFFRDVNGIWPITQEARMTIRATKVLALAVLDWCEIEAQEGKSQVPSASVIAQI